MQLIEECRKARTFKNDPHQWKYICIEGNFSVLVWLSELTENACVAEPFELTNTARSVYDPGAFERVKAVFVQSWLKLQSDRNLGSLFSSVD